MATKPKGKSKRKPKAKPKAKRPTKAATKLRPDGLREGSAGALLVDTVCGKAGATHAELCAVVKWKACLPVPAEVGSAGEGEAAQGKAGARGPLFRHRLRLAELQGEDGQIVASP